MKITLQKSPEVVAMFKLMASDDMMVAYKARQAFAAFIQGSIYNVIEAEAVLGQFFTPMTYDYGTPSTIPLAPLFDIRQSDFIRVWSQHVAGGLVSAQNMSVDEMPVMTHDLTSAVEFKLDYVRAARVDVVAAYLQWLAQEFLVRQELDSAAVLMTTAAQSQYVSKTGSAYQVYRTKTQGAVTVQDFNALATLMSRVNTPNAGGTPRGASRAITSMVGSPEFLEVLKNSAFQPQNTQASTTSIPSSDKFRDDIYDAASNPSWYGAELVTVYDMGLGYNYNILFGAAAGSNAYAGYAGNGTATFAPYNEQVVLAIDKRKQFLVKLAETSPDSSDTVKVEADSQWSNRSKTIGFFASTREGRVSLDGRNVVAMCF